VLARHLFFHVSATLYRIVCADFRTPWDSAVRQFGRPIGSKQAGRQRCARLPMKKRLKCARGLRTALNRWRASALVSCRDIRTAAVVVKIGALHDPVRHAPSGAEGRWPVPSLPLFLPALAADNVLRVSAIPDEAPTELQRKFAPLGKYLEAQTGMKVVFTPVSDYAAVVESLATRKIDLAWLGGFTCAGKIRTNGTAIPIAQREEDAKFTSGSSPPTRPSRHWPTSRARPSPSARRLHLGQPDAALLPAAGRPEPGKGLQERCLLRRP
jgi:hypothetical protein